MFRRLHHSGTFHRMIGAILIFAAASIYAKKHYGVELDACICNNSDTEDQVIIEEEDEDDELVLNRTYSASTSSTISATLLQ